MTAVILNEKTLSTETDFDVFVYIYRKGGRSSNQTEKLLLFDGRMGRENRMIFRMKSNNAV